MTKHTFTIEDTFMLDGQPFQILSGTVHYFRVVPEYWRDRLEKLKNMGCNTVEFYVPWNLHEPREGVYVFDGICDVVRFLELIQEMGLWAIVRPGPYICGEWEWGGLPYWLLKRDGIRVRTTDPRFLEPMKAYFHQLLSLIRPFQVDNGGPILMMQVENEYGSYGDDREYMNAVRDALLECGITVPLVTSDGDMRYMLRGGQADGAHPTINFGSQAKERLQILQEHLEHAAGKSGPLMCMEFWTGWFDYWGQGKHSVTPYDQSQTDLDHMLQKGNVNFYMFHGGTNFGFMSGSNHIGKLMPDVTSYDYDAPLSESGDITPKYRACQEVIRRYKEIDEVPLSTEIRKMAYGRFPVSEKVSLFATLDTISQPRYNPWPLSMEQLDQGYGYTLYRTTLRTDDQVTEFGMTGANDRAQVFLDEEKQMTLYDLELLEKHKVCWTINQPRQLDILMENMGRVNYGPLLNRQHKGIHEEVLLNNHTHAGWEHWTLPMDQDSLKGIDYTRGYTPGQPGFYQVSFEVSSKADTFLDMEGWGKGFVLLNGFQLGRFWEIGPQRTLYIPGPLLREGTNILTIFETEGKAGTGVSFVDQPRL